MLDIGSLNELLDDFTPHEKKYLSQLVALSKSDEESIEDRRDRSVTVGYRDYLYNILKYRNLKLEPPGTRAKRVIKARRWIDTDALERENYNMFKFSSIYLVTDVIFLPPDIADKFYKMQRQYYNAELLGVPDDICLRSMHKITDANNKSATVALVKSNLSERYLYTHNSWEFPIF